MRILRMLGMVVAVLLASGCDVSNVTINVGGNIVKGSGVLREEKRNVPDFTCIDLSGAFDVVVTCGKKQEISVSGDDNVVPHIKTEVTEGVLKVFLDQSVSTKNKIKLALSVPTVNDLRVSGIGDVDISSVSNKLLRLDVSGVGNVKAEGVVGALEITSSGAGNVEARKLIAKIAAVDVSGIGHVVLTAADELNATISGVGGVDYFGNPKVTEKVSGIGRVSKVCK